MAARRLIAFLIVLLVFSSVLAALAPQRERQADPGPTPPSSDTTTTATTSHATSGALIERRIPARPAEPAAIRVMVGDEVRLVVEVAEPGIVRIPALGRSTFASPDDPARFALLLRDAGSYAVKVADRPPVARLLVAG